MSRNFQSVKLEKYLASFVLVALLVYSSSIAFGQIELDGVPRGNAYSNPGNVGTADVTNGAWLYNVGNANIGTANVSDSGSLIENWNSANINEANVLGGTIYNRDSATIGVASLNSTFAKNLVFTNI